ncbi:D-alanyl-D-alanine carboxypeptidase/D-alanyl-D-alanine-endopeptidase [Mucilaginibacter limnophilus]|uniref:D-alanyl-D-alanine carboxypeptidase/D-alanyl-D-alanine-endopeptidase n=1 Tax=Mucilaginibacter limnophilus TaxID=1932778 RepID=A0A437MQA0_9SPHI|nr:D-alanyl-D-alanine carboxypeptidase/D-alanyl-D-alanine-endopeptidase [Mucilaginibacter limnophilus]RVT99820.1 D-alanyl-D-alanine carboxypeptidase/D-alanyl-D-alanine-endopeptidase [Mucilaginibacter limnophilus]
MRKRRLLLFSFLMICGHTYAQTLQQQLQAAFNKLQQDSQCRYASVSLTVLDAKTGEQVFAGNPNMGLATASTLKVVTSVTAFNLLGKDYQYQTRFGYNGTVTNGVLTGDIIIRGGGDPTLGSWRWASTKTEIILNQLVTALQKAGIKKITGSIIGDDTAYGTQAIPDGWIWQDVGNYYGGGINALSWHENQFDIKLKTGPAGTPVEVLRTVPAMPYLLFKSEVTNAPAGTGDQAYIYLPSGGKLVYLRGTYAVDQTKKTVSAALPDPAYDIAIRLTDTLNELGIAVSGQPQSTTTLAIGQQQTPAIKIELTTILSPELNKIIYWLNQKSVNLYAEQLLKSLAMKAGKEPTTPNGVQVLQDFWATKGIDAKSLNIYDGSGLSPGNRVTTMTMARVLQSAVKESWYNDFYESLPIYNDMKMKSGSIADVLAYAGYQTYNGHKLCFSIIVNNYNGTTKGIKEKMFRVLDVMK